MSSRCWSGLAVGCLVFAGSGCGGGLGREPRFPKFADDAGTQQPGDGGPGDSWSDGGTSGGSWSRSGAGSTSAACTPLPNDQCGAVAFEQWVELSATGLQQKSDLLAAQGYRVVQLAGYSSAGAARYAGLWQKCAGPAVQERHGLTRAQLQAAFDELGPQGYRPLQVSGYTVAGADLFAGIWVQRSGAEWESHHDLTATEYQQVFTDLKGRGYRLARVAAYGTPTAPRFTTLWERCAGSPWEARIGLTSSEYQQAVVDLLAQGYRPAQVAGAGPGEERYSAIWEKRSGAWEARHGLTSTQFQQSFDDLLAQGYRPYDVSAVWTGSSVVFNNLWTK